ncbi:hypothetical protein EON78_07690 [bacterium]|nr:MAG: hypothetical protein EON78_07690 [bacterium]
MTIPNILTLSRIALIPVFCMFIFDFDNSGFYKSSHPNNFIIAGWTVVIIIAREFLITGLRSMLADAGVKATGASSLGKTKTVLQIAAIIAFLFDIDKVLNNFIYGLAVVFTIISGVDYIWKSRDHFNFK